MPEYPRIVLRPHKDKALRRGYPWVFKNQLSRKSDAPERGAVVRVESFEGHVFGLGLYHDASLIAVRFLTSDPEATVDAAFFAERIDRAVALREAAFPDATHARLVFGESDGLPGTVVDRYGDVLTFTTLSFGMAERQDWVLDALEARLRPAAIVERNDAPLRGKDGLEERTGVLRGALDGPVRIEEAGVLFDVDVLGGPKTGTFIDQRLNRLAVRPFARGRRVLDVFCADGGFGLHAAAAGAAHVHFLDASDDALARVRHNAGLIGAEDRISTESADALDRLGALADEGADYDLIVLDPPGFAQSRRHVEAAMKAYQRINISALRILPPGGILATASCSQAVGEDDFVKMVDYSARKAGVRLRRLLRGTQPPDHPVLESMPETHYLTFYLFQKLWDEVPA
jgi:23S rRNA (cytosine1962-C5)-methyltransferase